MRIVTIKSTSVMTDEYYKDYFHDGITEAQETAIEKPFFGQQFVVDKYASLIDNAAVETTTCEIEMQEIESYNVKGNK